MDPIPGQHFGQIEVVDLAEAVEAIDVWQCALALDVGEMAERNGEFFVVEVLCDSGTRGTNVPQA